MCDVNKKLLRILQPSTHMTDTPQPTTLSLVKTATASLLNLKTIIPFGLDNPTIN